MKVERCEACLMLRLSSVVSSLNGERVCSICKPNRVAVLALQVSGVERCEGCYQEFKSKIMTDVKSYGKSQRLCRKCSAPKREWFCATIYQSETKVMKSIRKRLRAEGLDHLVRKIAVAKVAQTRTAKNNWGVYTHNSKLLGNVTAETHDDALHKAKSTFEPKSGKGSFKPTHFDENAVLENVMKTYEKLDGKRRVVWQCWGKNGKLLGKLYDRDRERATETAQKLYGPKEKIDRTQIVLGEVVEVKLDKVGGKTITQNKKALTGYLLIQCFKNSQVFTCIEGTPGVSQLLPHAKQDIGKQGWSKIENSESDIEKGKMSKRMSQEKDNWLDDGPPEPSVIDPKQIREILKMKDPVKPPEVFRPGDRVKINGGMMNGLEGNVSIVKDNKVMVGIKLLDQYVILPFDPTNLLK